MVQVERSPVVAATPPRREPLVLWLVVVAALITLDGLLPWERFCSAPFGGFPAFCFRAAVWSGSASLAGLLGEALGVSFVALAIWRGWITAGRIPSPGVTLGAGFLAAIAVKMVMVFVDAAQTSAVNSSVNTRSIGVWLGLLLNLVGWGLIVALISRAGLVRGSALPAVVASLAIGGVAVPYALSGLAWWGGPLAPPKYLGGGNGMGIPIRPGHEGVFSGLVWANNGGHVTATLDGFDFVDRTTPFHVREPFVRGVVPCPSGALVDHRFDPGTCGFPIGGRQVPPGSGPRNDVAVGAFVQVPRPGLYRVGWFRLRYHVGPLHYEIFNTAELKICAAEQGHRCAGSGF